VQELAARLIDAPDSLFDGIGLPEAIADAIAISRSITIHGARLRQRHGS